MASSRRLLALMPTLFMLCASTISLRASRSFISLDEMQLVGTMLANSRYCLQSVSISIGGVPLGGFFGVKRAGLVTSIFQHVDNFLPRVAIGIDVKEHVV